MLSCVVAVSVDGDGRICVCRVEVGLSQDDGGPPTTAFKHVGPMIPKTGKPSDNPHIHTRKALPFPAH